MNGVLLPRPLYTCGWMRFGGITGLCFLYLCTFVYCTVLCNGRLYICEYVTIREEPLGTTFVPGT